jgi:Histidine kinase
MTRILPSSLRQLAATAARIPLFWRVQLISWIAFSVLSMPLKTVAYGSLSGAVIVSLYRDPLGLILTSAFRRVYSRLGLGSDRPWRLASHILLISMAAGLFDAITCDWFTRGTLTGGPPTWLVAMFCFRSMIYFTWSFLYFWIRDQMAARKRLLDLARAETAARDAEILMLRAQVSPHFLFNAFNTILADIESRPTSLAPVVQGLADYFRYSLTSSQDLFVTLGEEFDAMVNYLRVEKARFRDSLVVDCHIDPATRDLQVPGVFLQPLVENALKYGHRTSPTPLRVSLNITATPQGGARVEVTNSGVWLPPRGTHSHSGHGQGLANLSERLGLLYRNQAQLRIPTGNATGPVTVAVEFPPYPTAQEKTP